MKPVFTAQQMRETEQRYFQTGVSSSQLMQTAALAFEREIERVMPAEGRTIVFACGKGGNGGDGYAAAQRYSQRGGRAIILSLETPVRGDTLEKYNAAKGEVFACIGVEQLDTLPVPDMWADCIFGTGLTRAPQGDAKKVIERMNRDRKMGARIVACDIPSGLDSDCGTVYGTCVQADVTVTFQTLKRGHLLGSGPDKCGSVVVSDIGIPEELYPNDYMELVEDEDVKRVLPKRPKTAHKNDFGHVLVVAGSRGMAGAAAICALSAMRSGAGLVTVACPESILNIIQTLAPCAMCVPLPEKNNAISDEAVPLIAQALKGKTAVAIGPGLSVNASVKCIELVLKSGLPVVADADALNVIAKNESLKSLLGDNIAITPHPGEARRLVPNCVGGQTDLCGELMRLGCHALVKGASTVIGGKTMKISTSGCNGMAKGGSGDALTGMVAAFMGQGMQSEEALWAASQLHGRAGEEAARRFGNVSMLATDLINCIGSVYPHEDT